MSYDLSIYSATAPEGFTDEVSRRFQIIVDGPWNVEPEDIPDAARVSLLGISFKLGLCLEGDQTQTARSRIHKLARRIAKSVKGVIYDEQTGEAETPQGVKRFSMPDVQQPSEAGEVLELTWLFMDVDAFASGGAERMLQLMTDTLPEILPKRYGLFEPPQHRLDRDGLEHFTKFLLQHLHETIVWCCNKPFEGVYVCVPERPGATKQGFRSSRVSVEISSHVLNDSGLRKELSRFWLSLAEIVSPFYAEIRLGASPIKSWWWNGVPASFPVAMLIGPPYTELWPEFAQQARRTKNGAAYVNTLDTETIFPAISIPEGIVQPLNHRVERHPETGEILMIYYYSDMKYPPQWPFEGPFGRETH